MAAGTDQVPTTGTVTGLTMANDMNAALSTVAGMHQGGTAPTTTSTGLSSMAGMLWHDTTNNKLWLRDQADTTWMLWGVIDETGKVIAIPASTLPTKSSPTTADSVVIMDAAASNAAKTATVANLRKALSGSVAQMVSTETGTVATGTTTSPSDNTVPQSTEGTQFMTLAVTPTDSASKLVIEITIALATSAAGQMTVALFQDAGLSALAATQMIYGTDETSGQKTISFRHVMSAGTTAATTFKVRAGLNNAATVTFNGVSGAGLMGGVMASSIVITEYLP